MGLKLFGIGFLPAWGDKRQRLNGRPNAASADIRQQGCRAAQPRMTEALTSADKPGGIPPNNM